MKLRSAALAAILLLPFAAGCNSSSAEEGLTLRVGVIGSGAAKKLTGVVGYLHDKNALLPELKSAKVTEIEVATFQNGPDLNQALAGGSLDLGLYGDTPALVGRGSGLPTRLIALSTVKLDAAILTKKGGVKSLKELEGKKIGVQVGSYIHRYLLGALARAGVKPKEILNMYTPAIVAALEKGDLDAGSYPAANHLIEEKKGFPVIDIASRDHPDLLGTSAVVATEKFLNAHPQLVKAWQGAQDKGVKDAKAHWDSYLNYVGAIGGYPPEITKAATLKDQLPDTAFPADGLALINGTKDFLVNQKIILKDFTVDSWIADGAK